MRTLLWVIVACLVPVSAHAEWVSVEKGAATLSVDVLRPTLGSTLLRYTVGGFERGKVEIAGQPYDLIALEKESKHLAAGLPALPNVCRSVILPDRGAVEVRVGA